MKKEKNVPLYNSRIINTYIKFINYKYNYINVNELLRYAKMETYQIEDPGHWFTQEQINRFHEKLKKMTGNVEIAREAGRYSASPEALGLLKQYVLGLVSPEKAYELMGKTVSSFTRATKYSSKKISSNQVEISLTPNEGVTEEPFQCENRFGYIEALANIFNYKTKKIEHPECVFKGGKSCQYIVSWKESPAAFWKRLRNYTVLSFAAIWLFYGIIPPYLILNVLTPVFICSAVFLFWYTAKLEIQSLSSAANSLKDSAEELAKQNRQHYLISLMVNELGEAQCKVKNTDNLLNLVMQILQRRLDFDRGIVLLANRYRNQLDFKAGYGYHKDQVEYLNGTAFSLNNPESKGIFVVSFKTQKPFLINDIDEIQDSFSQRSFNLKKKLGVKSFICCPIIYNKESLGILAVDNIESKRPLLQSDLNILMGIAPQIGISLHNSSLREAEARQFSSIIQVLEASIEAHKLTDTQPFTEAHILKKGVDSNGMPLL